MQNVYHRHSNALSFKTVEKHKSTMFYYSCSQGRPEADATDATALGPVPQGAPRHGGWAGCLFLPDTPCARES